ncbi:hypothetical protein CASFOL_004154 [Castilleja foliolosa]|uniref:Glucan endo-1,3-beta-D-glucosidase n=1 Tax=Castilleja foliolosa TaxID=1961234 RepID=A0ABD3EJ83_9LAMI
MNRLISAMALLGLFIVMITLDFTDAQTGVCYGMLGDNLPSAPDVVALYKQHNIQMTRLYDPNQPALEALRDSNISVILGVPNSDLEGLAASQANADAWVQNNVRNFANVNFKYIAVGNEVSPLDPTASFVLPAMQNINNAISGLGIKVSTSVDTQVLGNSYPPEDGAFRSDVTSYMNPIVDFLVRTESPLLVNVYPYFAYINNKAQIKLEYALFTSDGVVVPSGVRYQNLFYAIVDAMYAALEKSGGSSVRIVVSESGWPSAGGDTTTVEYASTYLTNLIQRVKDGTPFWRNYNLNSHHFGEIIIIGQVEFHSETLHTLNFVVNQSEYTVQTLRNVTEYLSMAKSVSVAQIFLPSDVMSDIDRLNVDLNNAADMLEQTTSENSSKIRNIFNTVRSALIIVAAVMLFVSILGFVLSIFGYLHVIHIFTVSGWLLVAITLIICGVSVILDNTISDTCMAMGEWVENPHAETALSNILPCVDQKTTNQTLFKSKLVINDIANMVNGFVGSIANSNPPPQANPAYYNQSGPVIPPLCYPYDSQLRDRSCSDYELSMGNASSVWQNYTCATSENGLCISIGRLTPNMYKQLVDAVNVSYALEHYTPPLLNLQNCNFVRDTFRNITSSYCRPLQHFLRIVNVGLAMISVGVMVSLAVWIFYANRPQREEVFAKLSLRIRGKCIGKTKNQASDNSITIV